MKRSIQALYICFYLLLFVIAGSVPAEIYLQDSFSGASGTSIIGRHPVIGDSVWRNFRMDNLKPMDGAFFLQPDGGIAAERSNQSANVYISFPAEKLSGGWTVKTVFSARQENFQSKADFTFGVFETVDKGNLINIITNDVVCIIYRLAGVNAGKFQWNVSDNSVSLNHSWSELNALPAPADELELSLTCYPETGMLEGRVYNLSACGVVSVSRIAVNTPALTNMTVAGFGLTGLAGIDSVAPAVVKSFSIESAPDYRVARPFLLPDKYPVFFPAFSFDKVSGTNDPEFPEYLEKHRTAEIIHSPRRSVFSAVRNEFPDKVLIIQDAFGGIGMFKEDLNNVFPGHCLLKPGTKLSADSSSSDTVLVLDDYRKIAASQSAVNAMSENSACLLLYALDENNQPDWTRAEHIKITAVNPFAGTITVERGLFGSAALNLQSGKAVVAAHMMFWSNQWQLNFSLDCPHGGLFNMTAAEWYALRKAQRVWQDGADGIEFDVARWQWGQPERHPMDCNNDLIADYGYINGINSFGLGAQVFFKTLRELLGTEKIIQMDSNDALFGQRGWQYVNGVQMESFPHANHFDRFSESFLHLRQWVENVTLPVSFSYPFTKTSTTLFGNALDENGNPADWRFRTGFAAALLTGMPHPFAGIIDMNFDPENPDDEDPELITQKDFYLWDEYRAGELNNYQWLGRPLNDAIQINEQVGTNDLLAGVSWNWISETGFSANCSIIAGEYNAQISALPENTLPWTSAFYSGTQVPEALWFGVRLQTPAAVLLEQGEEYTLEFEAKGDDSWNAGGKSFEKVPRSLAIYGIADYGFQKPAAAFLSPEWKTYRFSMIAATNALPPVFGFSEQSGSASVRNIRLYKGGAERWCRDFEHGRVYLNMTIEPWTVDVGTGVVQRLHGMQIPELNTGEIVNGFLTVPARDAVFLRTGTYDAWKTIYFSADELNNETVCGETEDPDNDSASNYDEYIAGTDPKNSASRFHIVCDTADLSGITISWNAITGRVYDVYWSTNLMSGFVPLQTGIEWTQPAWSNTVEKAGFYKVNVRRR